MCKENLLKSPYNVIVFLLNTDVVPDSGTVSVIIFTRLKTLFLS